MNHYPSPCVTDPLKVCKVNQIHARSAARPSAWNVLSECDLVTISKINLINLWRWLVGGGWGHVECGPAPLPSSRRRGLWLARGPYIVAGPCHPVTFAVFTPHTSWLSTLRLSGLVFTRHGERELDFEPANTESDTNQTWLVAGLKCCLLVV